MVCLMLTVAKPRGRRRRLGLGGPDDDRCPVAAGAQDENDRGDRLVAFIALVVAEKSDAGLRAALAG